jgi:uncharacterized alkaline shock family protein YloU
MNETKTNKPAPEQKNKASENIEGTELGSIRLHHNVIAIIARVAALKVPGVVEMSGGLADGIASMLGGRTVSEKGVRVEEIENGCIKIELNIIVEFGVNIPQLAWKVQNEVNQAIRDMTGKRVHSVDVVVQGVQLTKGKNKEEGGN